MWDSDPMTKLKINIIGVIQNSGDSFKSDIATFSVWSNWNCMNFSYVCWDRDLAQEIPEKVEKPTCIMILLVETQSQVICYKILNRSSGTPSKLARLKLWNSDICWRCNPKVGILVHMLFEYDKTNDIWNAIILFLKTILGMRLIKAPLSCLLGLLPDVNTPKNMVPFSYDITVQDNFMPVEISQLAHF